MFKRSLKALLVVALLATFALSLTSRTAAQTEGLLARVQARGNLICGVNGQLAGFGLIAPDGAVTGFDADFCRVIAAAIFGDATKVEFKPIAAADRWTALQSGEIDVLFRNSTWTLERDTRQGTDFGPTIFYDGQSFLTRTADNITDISGLAGATICVIKGTTTEANLADIIAANNLTGTTSSPLEDNNQVFEAFKANRCDAVTSDRSQLASRKASDPDGANWSVFEANFSKEPLGPAYRAGDAQWGDIVRWAIYATIAAEEYGVSSENVDAAVGDAALVPEMKRMLGVEGELNTFLGLEANWAVNVIKGVGNYAEIYERNLGTLGIARGINALYTAGGLLYAPPFR
jgi:general L-amino acid transport system substrate-binding protein